jgi:hypothetical protein
MNLKFKFLIGLKEIFILKKISSPYDKTTHMIFPKKRDFLKEGYFLR